MPSRADLIGKLAHTIAHLPPQPTTRVAVDGVDGAGKTTFADELAAALTALDRAVIRAGVDSFHHPRRLRYRRGRTSPEGFYRDSYNYPLLASALLDPLSPGGTGRFRTAAFDHETDRPVDVPEQSAPGRAVLILDGIFLHRPELRPYWNYSVFLRVDFTISIPRCARRDPTLSPDPHAETNRRYVEGQKLYFQESHPERHATVVINNEDLSAPFIAAEH